MLTIYSYTKYIGQNIFQRVGLEEMIAFRTEFAVYNVHVCLTLNKHDKITGWCRPTHLFYLQ